MGKFKAVGSLLGSLTGGLLGGTKVPSIKLPPAVLPAAPAVTAGIVDPNIAIGGDATVKNQRVAQRAGARKTRTIVDPLAGLAAGSGLNI